MGNTNGCLSDFYCTECGNKSLPVWRKKSSAREAGHLKKLYCIYCGKETNQVEISPKSGYTKEDFDFEFNHSNFENGQRKMTLKNVITTSGLILASSSLQLLLSNSLDSGTL